MGFALRMVILACAILFFGLAIRRAWFELSRSDVPLDWNSIRWGWLGLAVIFSMVGMVPSWIGWQAILRDFGQKVHWSACLHAYFLGHLGKYVPGKAMAVLLRVGELRRYGVLMGPAVLSVFIETLTGFASGGILGAVLLQWIETPRWLQLLALAAIPFAVLALVPYPFRWILKPLVRTRLGKGVEPVIEAIDGRLMLRTVAWALVAWMLQGLALYSVLESLKGLQPSLLSGSSVGYALVVCISSMSLGGLAGFLSMLPGGALARELASIGVLISIIPEPIALIATVLTRLTSILAELLMILISRWIRFRYKPSQLAIER